MRLSSSLSSVGVETPEDGAHFLQETNVCKRLQIQGHWLCDWILQHTEIVEQSAVRFDFVEFACFAYWKLDHRMTTIAMADTSTVAI